MGSPFRLTIIFKGRRICMHSHYGASLACAGKDICSTVRRLLSEIGYDGFCLLISKLRPICVKCEDDGTEIHFFMTDKMCDILGLEKHGLGDEMYGYEYTGENLYEILKSGLYNYDDDTDNEYQYTIDMNDKFVAVSETTEGYEDKNVISFDIISEGIDFLTDLH